MNRRARPRVMGGPVVTGAAVATAVASVLVSAAGLARATPPFEIPHSDRSVRQVDERLVVAAAGFPDGTTRRLSVVRAAARDQAERRGRDRLHRFVDDALARVWARPRAAAAAHGVIDAKVEVDGTRPLADGGAVVQLSIALSELAAVAPFEGAPWGP